uniref:Glutamate receptor n=1 Tax=Panagrellus redivivus TaxID=6233 RepID=A0A7E4UMD3_PANRE
MLLSLYAIFLAIVSVTGVIKIGALVQSKNDRYLLQTLWNYHNVSENNYYELDFIDFRSTADIADQLCRAVEATAKKGHLMAVIIGDSTEPRAMVTESAARELKLSYVSLLKTSDARQQLYRQRSDAFLPSKSIDIWPERVAVGEVIAELIDKYKTNTVFMLYNAANDLSTLQSYLRDSFRPHNERKTRFRLLAKNGDNAPLIKESFLRFQTTTYILHATLVQASGFIAEANELGVCNDENYFILTGLDFAMTDPQALRMGNCNVSCISFVDLDAPIVLHLRDYLAVIGYQDELPGRGVWSKTAVWSDTVAILKSALNQSRIHLENNDLQPHDQTCKQHPVAVRDFRQYLINANITNAATGSLCLTPDGQRDKFELFVYESALTNAWRKAYTWNSTVRHLQSTETARSYSNKKDNRLHLKVTVYLEEPFVMIKPDADKLNLTGNYRYDGYCIDLLEKISELRNFTYEIHEVRDKTYGVKESSGKWTGMVGELQSGVADLAVASLTVTYTRSEVLDFTVPYMHLGISILFKRPETSNPSLFHFMYPLGFDVWVLTLSAYIGTAFVLWGLARLSPNENRKKQGRFTLGNSFWFLVASLMQQGPEISPKSASTRLVTGFWWLFALIFISSYTANLAAFLTTERMITPIENADDLAKQTKINFVELIWHANKVAKDKSSDLTTELSRLIKRSWNEQRGKDDSLNRAIDELIEYKDGVPVGSYANPGAAEFG